MDFNEAMRQHEARHRGAKAAVDLARDYEERASAAVSEVKAALRDLAGHLQQRSAPAYQYTFKDGIFSRGESPVGFVLKYETGGTDYRKPKKVPQLMALQLLSLDGRLWNWHWQKNGEFAELDAHFSKSAPWSASIASIAGCSLCSDPSGLTLHQGYGDSTPFWQWVTDFASGYGNSGQPIEAVGLARVR